MNQRTILMLVAAVAIFVAGVILGGVVVSRMGATTGTTRESSTTTPAAPLTPRPQATVTTVPGQAGPAPSAPASAGITAEQAAAIATDYAGGGTVDEIELEDEDDYAVRVYEVKFTNGSVVFVDALTGDVVFARLRDSGPPRERHEERSPDRRDDDHDE